MKPRDLTIDAISLGDTASFERTWKASDVENFVALSGDENPLHTDEAYAASTIFKKRVVHGMLLGSLCSTLVGMYLPGKRCLYLKQSLEFPKPVFIGETVTVKGTVVQKSVSTGILEIAITITRNDDEVARGTAVVKVL